MIAEFTVENFYSICSKQTLSFIPTMDKQLEDYYLVEVKPGVNLLKSGIIYGANASGKSKVLNALEFFVHFMITYPQSKTSDTDRIPFLLNDHSKEEPTRMSMTFYVNGERYILDISFTNRVILSESLTVYASSRPALLYERTYIRGNDSTRVEFGKQLGLGKKDQDIIIGNTLNNCPVLAAFGKSNVERSRLNSVFHWLDDSFSQTITPANHLIQFLHEELKRDTSGEMSKFILKYLQESDFNIKDFKMSSDASSIIFSHETAMGIGTLPEDVESNGTLRFMAMAALLKYLVKDNQCIMIDEIETSLHYELLTFFYRTFLVNQTGTSQLLFTTHDINLLDEDFVRRDTIWFTDKDENAETQIIRLSSFGLHKNLSPYNAYRQGKLVKLPFTGDIFLTEEDKA